MPQQITEEALAVELDGVAEATARGDVSIWQGGLVLLVRFCAGGGFLVRL